MMQLDYYQTIEKIKERNPASRLLLFICGVTDENLGLILRSSEIFGVDGVIYFGESKDNLQKIKKISRGAEVSLSYTNDKNVLSELKNDGYSVIALEITDTAEPLGKITFGKKTCLVVGNEQHGVPQDVLDMCDKSYYIEMASKKITSLNVAIATSIALNKYLESSSFVC